MLPEKVNMVYLGTRLNEKMQKRFAWWRLDEDGKPVDDSWWFGKKMVSYARVGQVFEFEITMKDGSVTVHGGANAVHQGNYADKEAIKEWQSADALALMRKSNLSKSIASLPDHLETLDRFKRAYRNANSANRKLILAMILEYITAP